MHFSRLQYVLICPVYLIALDLITVKIFVEVFKF